jgi:phage-related protein
MAYPILQLDPNWEIERKVNIEKYEMQLGDNYSQLSSGGIHDSRTTWNVSKDGLTTTQKDQLVGELFVYAGSRIFLWTPGLSEPQDTYTCEKWQVTPLAPNNWRISGDFVQFQGGECEAYKTLLDDNELAVWLDGMRIWLTTYTRAGQPLMISDQKLIANAFHDTVGRGGYFPKQSGTSEGQFLMILAACRAFRVTNDYRWLGMAQEMAEAAVTYLYKDPIPNNSSTQWVPHWLFNAKGNFNSKGTEASDPLNYGHFDVTVNFVNGWGQIPNASPHFGGQLADVYSVYSTSSYLLWKNVFAPVIGTAYPIEFWNGLLDGINYRIYPDTASNAGTPPLLSGEPTGSIKLVGNFTGTAKVTFSTYTSTVISKNSRFEAYPLWRATDPTEINHAMDVGWWIDDSYSELADILQELGSPDTRWQRARDCTRYSMAQLSVIPNLTHWYKKDTTTTDPFIYPGTQVIQVNNTNGYTATRQLSGTFNGFLKVDVAAALVGTFPSLELQNYAVQAKLLETSGISVSVGSSTVPLLELVLSLNSQALNLTQLYTAYVQVTTPNVIHTETFSPEDFVRWGNYLVWHQTIADQPVYLYSGSGGSGNASRVIENIPTDGATPKSMFWRINLTKGAGYSGCGLTFVGLGKVTNRPPLILYRLRNGSASLKIKDAAGAYWTIPLTPNSNWVERQFQWTYFTGTGNPDTTAGIQAIEFEVLDPSCQLDIYWVAVDSRNRPERLDAPVQTYKASIVSRLKTAHTLYFGDYKPTNTPSDTLDYSPGVVPFTANSKAGSPDSWKGIPMSGYQSPYHWKLWGSYDDRYQQCLQFLSDAQAAYSNQNYSMISGPFAPAYSWAYWDNGDYLGNGLNKFGWDAPDPNSEWGGYQYRALEATARAFHLDPTNVLAGQITMSFLGYLDFMFVTTSLNPPTNYIPVNNPQIYYIDPHAMTLILRAAMWANLAGGDSALTFRIIKRMLDALRQNRVITGNMAGTFTAGQSTFSSGGQAYRENFGFWSAEIVSTIALLRQYREQINVPPCSSTV